MDALLVLAVFFGCLKIFWCDLKQSYVHACPACWLGRYLATIALAMLCCI